MKPYVLSGTVGLLVGVIYGALDVKSPAPPVVALIGLLGMLGGEQLGKKIVAWHPCASTKARVVAPGQAAVRQKPSGGEGR